MQTDSRFANEAKGQAQEFVSFFPTVLILKY